MTEFGPYDQAAGARDTVGALAGNFYYTDVPLSAAQADQLTKIVAANTGEMAAKGAPGCAATGELGNGALAG